MTVLVLIRACTNLTLGSLGHAQFIQGAVVRGLFEKNIMVDMVLVDLYVKRERLRTARTLFDWMKERNFVSWSMIISVYGMHGFGKDALELFDQMKGLIRPDHIVFVAMLSACSHSGLIDEGWRCFNYVEIDFGTVPRAKHYVCMVDLLGRAGKLNKDPGFIERMLIQPDSSVWDALLGACRMHPNVEIAELAARSPFELDSKNSGSYILLPNVYTSLGKIKEANRIRSLMRRERSKEDGWL